MNYLTISQTAKRLGKSRQWIWFLVRAKELKAKKYGNQYLINESDVKKYQSQSDNKNESED
ncbi:MAG: helix-turn-helix domain-containing protein [Melioribacteraceae bacterium]|nr:helix-turn-helix domain-containing protein [Melioribacteraceae bacterium]